ncbi:hypothetical protein SAMN06265795_1352 [Noviherbaspirillum humi]|uniref:Uncharacterized protein n=1 Tax=Noviherbaspirillum humi TaxID=1688639 RepID=A0A239M7X3_9BURK|nr:hypothetical protein [Noviherbaspirillum humi]SNT38731.1 hypothetical protein SAMN06265795_1352 [Noviherbaspirillum humi]
MSRIKISDLANSVTLDREAMKAVTGGARNRGYQPIPASSIMRRQRIVDYPPGMSDIFTGGKVKGGK